MEKTRPEKSKEEILAERQAKKAAKKQGRKSDTQNNEKLPTSSPPVVEKKSDGPEKNQKPVEIVQSEKPVEAEKPRDQVMAEREARKLAKQAGKKNVTSTTETESNKKQQPQISERNQQKLEQKQTAEVVKINSDTDLAQKMEKLHISDTKVKEASSKPTTKAERRALQEAQRAAKAKTQQEKVTAIKKPTENEEEKEVKKEKETKPTKIIKPQSTLHKVRLFKHLYTEKCDLKIKANSEYHPAIVKTGSQYANNTIVGSNSRCYAFLNAMKLLITDFTTPPSKEFPRALEAEIQKSVDFLHACRPMAVSMMNALKYIKMIVSQERSTDSDEEKKQRLIEKIDTYAHEQIETAAKSISLKVREKILENDIILTYGCSSLIKRSLVEAWKHDKNFSVVVVDSRPDHEGQEMLKSLAMEGISCTYLLINAISFIMPKVTKVLLGAHALLANGYVMSRVGTAQIAMVANSYNVPVLVCCETHKFSERVQTDSFVYNEIGDPNALARNKNSKEIFEYLKDWESLPYLTPLNLRYDITPPELITAVVTEVALLPCTSVQVILRVKPSE